MIMDHCIALNKRSIHITLSIGTPHLLTILVLEFEKVQGPVVQSIVSLTSSLRFISLTVLACSIHNILIFFAAKM